MCHKNAQYFGFFVRFMTRYSTCNTLHVECEPNRLFNRLKLTTICSRLLRKVPK